VGVCAYLMWAAWAMWHTAASARWDEGGVVWFNLFGCRRQAKWQDVRYEGKPRAGWLNAFWPGYVPGAALLQFVDASTHVRIPYWLSKSEVLLQHVPGDPAPVEPAASAPDRFRRWVWFVMGAVPAAWGVFWAWAPEGGTTLEALRSTAGAAPWFYAARFLLPVALAVWGVWLLRFERARECGPVVRALWRAWGRVRGGAAR